MRLTQINQRTLITEGWNDPRLTLLETKYIVPFVQDVERYIVEAQLKPNQINQLFTDVEQGATAAGGNRTLVGKGKDAASFINKKIDELGAQLKKAGPVQNADAKFAELKAKIGATDSKVAKGIQAVSDWAKANPGKASIAVGILTAAAAMAAGPLGGAIAGFLARATKDLLQGTDLSTAVGKAAKTGALGALIGLGVEGLGDAIEGTANVAADTLNPSYVRVSWDYMETVNGVPEDWANAYLVGFPDDIAPVREAWDKAIAALKENDYATFDKEWATIEQAVERFNSEDYLESLDATADAREEWAKGITAFSKMADGVQAAAQGAAQASDNNQPAKAENIIFKPIQIETIIEWCDETPAVVLTEGPLDAIGGALKKGAAAVGAKAKTIGKNITTKVTADKLASAWKKAGSPTDSDAIANILRQQGVSDTVLAPIYKTMGAKLPAASRAANPTQSTKAQPAAGAANPTQSTKAQPTAQPAAGATDFKSLQKTFANLNAQDAATLVTYIDSLAAKTTPTTQGQAATTAAPKNAAASDTYEKAKGDVRKVQSGTKPIPPNAAADIQGAIAKLAKGDKESGVFAAQKIMNLARAGVDVSKQQQAWVANAKAGERFLTQSQYFEIIKMLREHNLSWSDLGIRVHLLENTNKLFGISLKER